MVRIFFLCVFFTMVIAGVAIVLHSQSIDKSESVQTIMGNDGEPVVVPTPQKTTQVVNTQTTEEPQTHTPALNNPLKQTTSAASSPNEKTRPSTQVSTPAATSSNTPTAPSSAPANATRAALVPEGKNCGVVGVGNEYPSFEAAADAFGTDPAAMCLGTAVADGCKAAWMIIDDDDGDLPLTIRPGSGNVCMFGFQPDMTPRTFGIVECDMEKVLASSSKDLSTWAQIKTAFEKAPGEMVGAVLMTASFSILDTDAQKEFGCREYTRE